MSGSIRIVEMPDLGSIDASSSFVGERAGSGRFSSAALQRYIQTSAAPTLYVSPTGSDSNAGTSASPFLTIQKAVDYAQANTVASNNAAQIMLANGTYSAGCTISRAGFAVYLTGNANPALCMIADTTNAAAAIIAYNACTIVLQGITITSLHGSALFPAYAARMYLSGQMIFGTCALGHLHTETGGWVHIGSSYTISGGAPAHVECMIGGGVIYTEGSTVVTLTGTPAFSNAFAALSELSYAYIPYSFVSFSGAATGKRYNIESNSVCETLAAPATFLPGNAPGVTQSNGILTPIPVPTITGFSGSGGTATLVTNSTDRAGIFQLAAGVGATASGDVTITEGAGGGVSNVVPTASLLNGTGTWASAATIRISANLDAYTTFHWDNAGTVLTSGQTYFIGYNLTPI